MRAQYFSIISFSPLGSAGCPVQSSQNAVLLIFKFSNARTALGQEKYSAQKKKNEASSHILKSWIYATDYSLRSVHCKADSTHVSVCTLLPFAFSFSIPLASNSMFTKRNLSAFRVAAISFQFHWTEKDLILNAHVHWSRNEFALFLSGA